MLSAGTYVLHGHPFTVAGVLQPSFMLDAEVLPTGTPADKIDIFAPLPLGADAVKSRGDENYNIMVRLKPGVSVRQAQADIDVITSRIREKDKRDASFGMDVVGLQEQVVGDVRRALLVVFGSVGLVLLMASANVANLLLTRATGREKEVAIRAALGAGWQRLARQLLTESILLGLLGGVAGLAVAQLGLSVVRTMNPGNIPRLEDIAINGPVLAFTFAVSLLTGILFGVAPVWRAVKVDLNTSLKVGGRSGQGDGGLHLRRHGLRGLLVISELTISLMLLIGAGLLIRSFVRLQSVPLGFTTDHVLTMEVATTIANPKYRGENTLDNLYRELESRVAHLPGVLAEGIISALPLSGELTWAPISVEGYAPQPGQELQVDYRTASTNYFRTMEIPLRRGRFFTEGENRGKPLVVIIDEKCAQRFWPDSDPIGKHLWFDPKTPITIVGVVGVVKQYGPETDGRIAIYFPQEQWGGNRRFLAVRTSSEATALSSAVVSQIQAVDPGAAVYGIRTMQERLHDSQAQRRFSCSMLGAFAAFALSLAAVGLYGVMSHLVTQGNHDIGVMVTLGARPGNIIGLVVQQGMALAGIGILTGLAAAAALTRVMANMLFEIDIRDALTFGTVPLLLAAVAFAATAIPAWRATRVDPMVALREE